MKEFKDMVMVEPKKWYKSLTLQANAVMVLIVIIQFVTSTQVLDPDVQLILGALLNILLRFKTTMPIK